jgi:hypothetical protein
MSSRCSCRQKGHKLRKEFRALMGDPLANYWEGEWENRATGGNYARVFAATVG